jgi:diguanylate cyclase (GGDEF)-like protein
LTLRARLTLFFVGIVVLPLVAATLAYQILDARQTEARTNTRLETAANAVSALWEDRLRVVQRDVGFAAERLAPSLDGGDLEAVVEEVHGDLGLDFLVVSDEAGRVVEASLGPAEFSSGAAVPTAEQIAGQDEPAGVLRARVDVVAGDGRFMVTGGRYTDELFAMELAAAGGLDVAIVRDDEVLATNDLAGLPADPGSQTDGDHRTLLVTVGSPGNGILLAAPTERSNAWGFWLIAAAGLVIATTLGYALARVIARPLERLAEGARAVTAGNLDTRVEAGERGDVAHVAQSFNTMTEYLRTYVGELQESRDELRRSLERMGATLQTTLNLQGMLEVILDTASVTLGAQSSALFLLTGAGRELRLEVARGYDPPEQAKLSVGLGIAGQAAAGDTVLVPGDLSFVASVPVEPRTDTAVAVPLVRRDRTMGVIALYGRSTLELFTEDDAETLASFGAQASVAIENVLLHQETQQLSITDGLTGVWNRRYLELTLRKEIERAQRFGRPLSILMLDIDRFKAVNDRHGHQRGDEVLVELTRRVMGNIRGQIDSVARYGGEEFVIVLPETPCEGAMVVGEKVRAAIRDVPFDGAEPTVPVTISVGVAAFPLDGSTSAELIEAADRALYRAKRAGRDRVVSAS